MSGPTVATNHGMNEIKKPTWDDVRRIADQLQLKMHLAGMEARDRWAKLQPRLAELEQEVAKGGERAATVMSTQLSAVGDLLEELRADIEKKLGTNKPSN